jgi:hypothetical protein
MNITPHPSTAAARDAARARFARRVAVRLDEQARSLEGEVAERLRFGRERALERARLARSAARSAPRLGVTAAGAALLGGSGWWLKVASLAPLAALVCGLVLIQQWQTRTQIDAAAEVDAALLADDLPPTAYRDAGFAEFLKTAPRD